MDSVPAEGAARIILGAAYLSAGRWDEAERELTSEAAVGCSIAAVAIMRRVTLARLLDARGNWERAGGAARRDRSFLVPARCRLALDDAGGSSDGGG